jgi:FlaA1/EpsC-like NDP-sugar epimerase
MEGRIAGHGNLAHDVHGGKSQATTAPGESGIMLNEQRLLVTGGAGFIGSQSVRAPATGRP